MEPHRRYNPLLDEWLIVAAHRASRPWTGLCEPKAEKAESDKSATEAKKNPLQPGGTRANGQTTPDYNETYTFTNDFPALLPASEQNAESAHQDDSATDDPLFRRRRAAGTCRVMCYHPDPAKHLATMELADVESIIVEWQRQVEELGKVYDWVQIFENRGATVGCSNPHPHCQIWASDFLPNIPMTKERTQREYYDRHGSVMLLDYARREMEEHDKVRVVVETDHWIALVPYWAMWPFETMLLPRRRHIARLVDVEPAERTDLALCMRLLLTAYDNLFMCPFPYSMGWLGAPTGAYQRSAERPCDAYWQLHAEYKPPLLRSSTVRKFMAGYELLAEPQRDLTAEMAADRLRRALAQAQQQRPL